MNSVHFYVVRVLIVLAFFSAVSPSAYAARLWSSGCELQGDTGGTLTDSLEWQKDEDTVGNIQVSTSIKRSGLSGCRSVTSASWGNMYQQFSSANETTDLYFRFYFRIASASATLVDIFGAKAASATGVGDEEGSLVLNTNGTLSWYDDDSTLLATSVTSLSSDTWYRIEVNYDAVDGVEVLLDGVQIILIGAHDGDGVGNLHLGICVEDGTAFCSQDTNGQTTADFYFDDVAINDTSGTAQTSWPGVGSIVHADIDGAGDNSGCSAGSYASVDERTPDSSDCILPTDGGGDILDATVESASSAGIDSYDAVTLVQVGVRELAETAAAESWKLRVKSASSGTVAEGTTTSHNDTTYRTNGDAAPRNYTLTSYTDPTTAAAWTPTGANSLDNMQIGIASVDAAPDINVDMLWGLIEYVDGVATAPAQSIRRGLFNTGKTLKIFGGKLRIF